MDCARMPSLFSERLDQELAGIEQAAFDAHLEECPACRREWRIFKVTLSRVRSLEPVPVPPDLLPAILAGVAERRPAASPAWLARLLAYWRRMDFSVSLPTAAVTVAVAMMLAVVVQNSSLSLPGGQGQGAAPGAADTAATQLEGERPRLAGPAATLATTSPRSYYPPFSPYDTVPAHPSALRGPAQKHPDVLVIFQDPAPDTLARLFRESSFHASWRVEHPARELLLLDLPPGDLPRLREMLTDQSVAIAPVAALSPDFGRDKKSIRVAIRSR